MTIRFTCALVFCFALFDAQTYWVRTSGDGALQSVHLSSFSHWLKFAARLWITAAIHNVGSGPRIAVQMPYSWQTLVSLLFQERPGGNGAGLQDGERISKGGLSCKSPLLRQHQMKGYETGLLCHSDLAFTVQSLCAGKVWCLLCPLAPEFKALQNLIFIITLIQQYTYSCSLWKRHHWEKENAAAGLTVHLYPKSCVRVGQTF